MANPRSVWEKNFAVNRKIRERVTEEILPVVKQVRENRAGLEDELTSFFNMWDVKHDDNHTYMGRAKLYVPEVRKNVESQARQLTEAAMPSEDFFDVSPGPGGTRKGALIRKSIARWQIEQMQLRLKLHVFNRQEVLYGTSPVYIGWREQTNRILRRARNKKGKIEIRRDDLKVFCGPDFVTRDLMRWYALNPKKPDHKEDGCFEDLLQNYYDLLAAKKKGLIPESVFEEILEGNSEALEMDELSRYVERVEQSGLLLRNEGYAGEANSKKDAEVRPQSRNYLCTRIFLPWVLPEACEAGEDPEMPIPIQIDIFSNEHVGCVMRNQYWHQQDPYLVGKYILPNSDEFYGQGLPKAVQYMQHELNSTAEQTMDSKTLALNPLAAIDPALAAQLNDFEVHPGAKWFVRPDGVKLFSLPDLSGTGYAAMAQLRGQMQEYSDRTPALPPQMQGKARTATQADIIEKAYTVDLKSFQLQNEIGVYQPFLSMCESLTDQNIEDDQVIMILGRRATDWRRKLISKNSVLGSYAYFWKATSSSQNDAVQARQMLDALKVMNMMQPEDRAKLMFNAQEFWRVLWSEKWKLPDADKIFGYMGEMQSTDPEVEHKELELGMEIEVLPGDNDEEHVKAHLKRIEELDKDSFERKQLELHALMHSRQAEAKEKRAKQMEMMQKLMIMQAQAAQQGASQGKTGAVGSGNRSQMNSVATVGDAASGIRA